MQILKKLILVYLQCTVNHTFKSLELQLLAEGHGTEWNKQSIFSRESESVSKSQKGNSVTPLHLKGKTEREKKPQNFHLSLSKI